MKTLHAEVRTFGSAQAPARLAGWFLPIANIGAWLVFVGIALVVQPAIDPEAPVDVASTIVSTVLWITMFAALFALASRQRWGYGATGVGGLLLIGAATSCFMGGHTGLWLVAQGLAGMGLATTGAASWKVSGTI